MKRIISACSQCTSIDWQSGDVSKCQGLNDSPINEDPHNYILDNCPLPNYDGRLENVIRKRIAELENEKISLENRRSELHLQGIVSPVLQININKIYNEQRLLIELLKEAGIEI